MTDYDYADAVVNEAALLAGIASETVDAFGRRAAVAPDTRAAILAGLGLPTGTTEEARATLDRLRRLRGSMFPLLVPALAETTATIPINIAPPLGRDIEWSLADAETGEAAGEGRSPTERRSVAIPIGSAGYYWLRARSGAVEARSMILAAPAKCFLPPELEAGRRLWGVTAQLVALRSAGDFGAGDFGSVREAVARTAPFGASFMGLSPVHALFAADRSKYGPYGPSSRLMLDPAQIDVSEFARAQGVAPPDALSKLPLADHAAVWAAKLPILERAFGEAHERAQPSPAVATHAVFEALCESFAGQGIRSAREWPPSYRDPASPELARFRTEFADRVAFHAWLQEVADRQLRAAADEAKRAGMAIGLYADLAVGADPDGSEVWSSHERYASALSIGATPDPLAPQGQDWGIVPLNPIALEEDGLAGFRALIAANMRHAGAIRIDHAFQLRRLYLVAGSEGGRSGAFVDFPFDALLACLRIESHRAECMVIGEDLGTAPPGFSDRMMESGALSYRVLFFERGHHGTFKPPSHYPETAVAVFTTHDLPTIRGWWAARDLDARRGLGLIDEDEVRSARHQRHADKVSLMEALRNEGLATDRDPPSEPPIEAIVRYLARSRSVLAALQLEDVAGEIEQANLPGTVEGHPNWRRRLSLELREIAAPDGPLARLARAMEREGRGEA